MTLTGLQKTYFPAGNQFFESDDGEGNNIGRSSYIRFGWTGMYHEPVTGLYHTLFREYDPLHSRWLSEDPAGYKDGLNLYGAYFGVNGVDPLGLYDPKNRSKPKSDSFAWYFNKVVVRVLGYKDAIEEGIEGTAHMVASPLETAEGLKTLALNPIQSYQLIEAQIKQDWHGGDRKQSKVIFGAVTTIVSLPSTIKSGVNFVRKSGELVKKTLPYLSATAIKAGINNTKNVIVNLGKGGLKKTLELMSGDLDLTIMSVMMHGAPIVKRGGLVKR